MTNHSWQICILFVKMMAMVVIAVMHKKQPIAVAVVVMVIAWLVYIIHFHGVYRNDFSLQKHSIQQAVI